MDDLYDAVSILSGAFGAAKNAGISEEAWERFRRDPGFRNRTREFWENGAFSDPMLDGSPGNLYGPRAAVFGPDEWEAFFETTLTPGQQRIAEDFPWENMTDPEFNPEEHFFFLGLRECGRSYDHPFAVMTLAGLMQLTNRAHWSRRPHIGHTKWMGRPSLPPGTVATRWYCMSIAPNGSSGRDLDDYEMPKTAEYLLAHILYYQKYGRLMTPLGQSVMCSDLVVGEDKQKRLALEVDRETKHLVVVSVDASGAGTGGCALMRKLPS